MHVYIDKFPGLTFCQKQLHISTPERWRSTSHCLAVKNSLPGLPRVGETSAFNKIYNVNLYFWGSLLEKMCRLMCQSAKGVLIKTSSMCIHVYTISIMFYDMYIYIYHENNMMLSLPMDSPNKKHNKKLEKQSHRTIMSNLLKWPVRNSRRILGTMLNLWIFMTTPCLEPDWFHIILLPHTKSMLHLHC